MVNTSFATPFYIKKRVADHYNWLRADFRQGFAIELRAYDDGVAYRFISTTDRSLVVASEEAGAAFPEDWTCWVPYVRDCDGTEIVPFGSQFKTSFENLYTVTRLSKLDPARLAFLPLVVAADDGVKLCFTEADLQAYPGMYFNYPGQGYSLRGIFAPYPKRTHDGGHDNLQNVVDEYDNFIAKAAPRTSFPWRTILIAREDRQLLDHDMVMRLAEPSRLEDVSWIRPGLAAWEWWNDWGLHGVGFEAGINTPTYKHYIDFAARNGIAYLVMDDGWSKDKTDLMSGGSDASIWKRCCVMRRRRTSASSYGRVTAPSTATWRRFAAITQHWASKDSKSTSWTVMTSRSPNSSTAGRLPPPNTDYCSTTTVYISLPVCNAPIPTSSISKAYMDWNR